MKILQILVLIFGLFIVSNAQSNDKAVLSGTVADINGGVIPKVKILLTGSDNKSFSAITNNDGFYSLQVPAKTYTIKFFGVSGFLTTNVENYRIAPIKMTLDVILEIDMESPTTIYSEFICEPNKDKKEELDCRYVSCKGNGTSKPTNVKFQTVNKTKN